MNQEIRFCVSPAGVRIAYASIGNGPPLVKAANWLSHLEFDWQSPVWRHWLEGLQQHHTLIRYNETILPAFLANYRLLTAPKQSLKLVTPGWVAAYSSLLLRHNPILRQK